MRLVINSANSADFGLSLIQDEKIIFDTDIDGRKLETVAFVPDRPDGYLVLYPDEIDLLAWYIQNMDKLIGIANNCDAWQEDED